MTLLQLFQLGVKNAQPRLSNAFNYGYGGGVYRFTGSHFGLAQWCYGPTH